MKYRLVLALAPALLFTACDKDDPRYEAEDERNPHFEDAQKAIHNRDYVAAVKSYENALRKSPKVASAHYELGMLYSEKLGEPIGAIYHLQKYLTERPSSDKAEMAKGHLDNARINFAATLPNSPVQNAELFAKIQAENFTLKKEREDNFKRIGDLENSLTATKEEGAKAFAQVEESKQKITVLEQQASMALAVTKAVPPNAPTAPATSATTAAQATLSPATAPGVATAIPTATPSVEINSSGRTHTIKQGDTLWKVAKQYYPKEVVAGIDRIKAANTDKLPEGKPLKIGTVITIP
jgi:LysM repeat protein